MSDYIHQALNLLKEKGLRITKPRRLVLELLNRTDQALSAYEIRDVLTNEGETVDTVSIYRILETLEEHKLIHRLLLSGKVRRCALDHEAHCQLQQEEHCHHLLICERCNRIEEVHCPGTESLVQELEKKTHFTIHHHRMEFTGLCQNCG